MFKNLIAEMARAGFTNKAIAREINISEIAYGRKINGVTDWKVTEMVAVQKIINDKLGTSYALDYLFKSDNKEDK